MRTTIDLNEEAYQVARAVARERNLSLGKVVSEFILMRVNTGRAGQKPGTSAAGFPLFSSGKPATSEAVRALLEED